MVRLCHMVAGESAALAGGDGVTPASLAIRPKIAEAGG
jgi:hypothetical protein